MAAFRRRWRFSGGAATITGVTGVTGVSGSLDWPARVGDVLGPRGAVPVAVLVPPDRVWAPVGCLQLPPFLVLDGLLRGPRIG
jgi:hypothetical protein